MAKRELHDYEWAMAKLEEGYAVARLEWPEKRYLVEVYLVSAEQSEALSEAYAEAKEKGWDIEQHLAALDYTEAISLVDEYDFDETIPNWTPWPDDEQATDWHLAFDEEGEDE